MKSLKLVRLCVVGLLVVLLAGPARAGELAQTTPLGNLTAIDLGGDYAQVRTNIRIPWGGWKHFPGQEELKDVKRTQEGPVRTWQGRLELERGKNTRFEQTLSEKDGQVRLAWTLTPQVDVKTEGMHLWLDVPIADFAGGRFELTGVVEKKDAKSPAPRSGELPREQPARRHVAYAEAGGFILAGPGGQRLEAALDKPCGLTIQDNREYKGNTYSVFLRFSPQELKAGQAHTLRLGLKVAGPVDTAPARLSVDAPKVRYRLHGFGGNYCFAIESPVTQYTLEHLRVAWARTEMTLNEWEPQNDNASPAETDWAALTARDKEGTNLRREFLLARQIQQKGIPYAISIWHLPEWLYSDPGKGPGAHGRQVGADKWDELLESIGSYLVHAKKQYGVEPDLFSFNEPDYGVRVKLSPVEHRDAIKRIGKHLAGLGLKTKMLLADVAQPRDMHTFCLPTTEDAEAMKYVGAVGFHSWGGAKPAQYAAWGDLAERLKLPLLVAEAGVDASAWKGGAYDSYAYGLREARLYQELILYARMQGTMQWEFTGDYGLCRTEGGAVKPTQRFWIMKHFCNLTPPNADVLTTASDCEKVLLTGFAGRDGAGKTVYAFHVVNGGAGRVATLTGLPAELTSLRMVRTSEQESFLEAGRLEVRGGTASLKLPTRCIVTLTTAVAGSQ